MTTDMDTSQHNQVDSAEATTDSQLAAVSLDASCLHEVCGQTSVSLSATNADHTQFNGAHAVSLKVIQPSVNLLRTSYIDSQTSPPSLTAISPISICLRI